MFWPDYSKVPFFGVISSLIFQIEKKLYTPNNTSSESKRSSEYSIFSVKLSKHCASI